MGEPVVFCLPSRAPVEPDPAASEVNRLLEVIADLDRQADATRKVKNAAEAKMHDVGRRLTQARADLAVLVDRR